MRSQHHPEEVWGIEDPRATWLPNERMGDRLHGVQPPRSADLAGNEPGLPRVHQARPAMPPRTRTGRCSRGASVDAGPSFIARSSERTGPHLDVVLAGPSSLGDHSLLLPAREGACGTPARSDWGRPAGDRRWVAILYHGVRGPPAALFIAGDGAAGPGGSADRPEPHRRVDLRSGGAIRAGGDVAGVVFPCGWVAAPERDELRLYYGVADSAIALATARLSDVVAFVRSCPRPPMRRATDRP